MSVTDAERLKDKIEVSLDSRQIFFLFFGGTVVACLVFVLGIMVGRRLEARAVTAKRPATSAAADPLAALDELAADEQADDLAFPSALRGEDRQKPLGAADTAKPIPVPKPAAPAPAAPQRGSEDGPGAAENVTAKTDPTAAKASRSKRFTLQLSSFQERSEAEAFVTKLTGAGYKPYVVESAVEGRGIFFRVRLGEYSSRDDALAAKTEFERRQHIIAYVTKL